MSDAPAFDCFVSHATGDAAAADALGRQLEARGLRCWIAPRDVPPGFPWAEGVRYGIERSTALAVLVSQDANRSQFVLKEVHQAVSLDRLVLPVWLERIRLSRALDFYLGPIHWLSAREAPLPAQADVLARAIRGDASWRRAAQPPSLLRTLRFRPLATLAVPFAASLAAGAVLLGGGWAVWQQQRTAEQRTLDLDAHSLGTVALDSAQPLGGGRWTLNGSVSLFGDAIRFADVRVALATGGQPVDLQGLDAAQVGGGQLFSFDLDLLGDTVVACLTMPHPRLPGRWRVTQAFAASPPPATDDTRPRAFRRVAAARVEPEAAQPCR